MSKEEQLRDACGSLVEYESLDEVKGLIDEGVDVDSSDQDGKTPLMWAATCDHVGIIRLLLDNGADVNNRTNRGTTALYGAAWYCNNEAVKLLIERGADIQAKKHNNQTPLDIAKRHCRSTEAIIKKAIKSTKGKND